MGPEEKGDPREPGIKQAPPGRDTLRKGERRVQPAGPGPRVARIKKTHTSFSERECRGQTDLALFQLLPFTSCVTLSGSPSISERQFPLLENGYRYTHSGAKAGNPGA